MSFTDLSKQAYAPNCGFASTNFPFIAQRDPNSNDIYYPIGKFWVNQAQQKLWYLQSQSNASGQLQSTWELISAATLFESISDTANTPVFPTSSSASPNPNNIQLVGGTGISIVATPGSNLLTITNTGETTQAISGIIPDAFTAPGTNPVDPSVSGNVTIEGGITYASGTRANPIRTNSLAVNSLDLEIQLAGSNAGSSTANNFGVCQFDSNQFTVTSGFASINNYAQTTFTPTLSFGGGSTDIVYTNQTGVYTRFFNLVFFTLTVSLSNKGSSTGIAAIGGLPVNTSGSGVIAFAQADNVTYTAGYNQAFLNFNSGTSTANVDQTGSGIAFTNLDDTNFSNNSAVRCTGFYYTSFP